MRIGDDIEDIWGEILLYKCFFFQFILETFINEIVVLVAMLILRVLYFMLPGYFANMAPVFFKKGCHWMAVPIDFNKKLDGKPIFGKNKTYRGFIFGVFFAVIIAYLQFLAYRYQVLSSLALVDYSNWFLIGFLLGFGALFGDLLKSFVKRRLNIKPGDTFIPFDQLDHVVGALLFVSLEVKLSWAIWIIALGATFFLHILINRIGFYLKFRDTKW